MTCRDLPTLRASRVAPANQNRCKVKKLAANRAMMRKHTLRLVVRIAIGSVFLLAGSSKLWQGAPDHGHAYSLAHAWAGGSRAGWLALAGLELLMGVWIAAGWRRRAALLVALGALSAGIGLMGAELRRPHPRPCGCLIAARPMSASDARANLVYSILVNVVALACALGLLRGQDLTVALIDTARELNEPTPLTPRPQIPPVR